MPPLVRLLLRRLRFLGRPHARARVVAGVPGRVHDHDLMLFDETDQRVADYLRAGASALSNLEAALGAAGRELADVASFLDLGCGHGRVLRQVVQRIDPSRVTACDLDAVAVRFCRHEFAVRALHSSSRPEDIELGSYDLIWAGSVFTHLPPDVGDRLLGRLLDHLLPGGILVVSFHGQLSLDHLESWYGGEFRDEADEIRRQVEADGAAFRPYVPRLLDRLTLLGRLVHLLPYRAVVLPAGTEVGQYGTTWHRAEHLAARAGELARHPVEVLLHSPHGWDHHHDTLAIRRVAPDPPASGASDAPEPSA